MNPQILQRATYGGAPIDGIYTVKAIKFSKFKPGENFRTYDVTDLGHYESGCHEHKQCFGHMCKTPSGTILPPQSMSMRTMEIATEYYTASKFAFAGDTKSYIEKLRSTNYTKKGTMRCIMATPVAGSCRLIATPQWEFGREYIAISENLASRMKVCKRQYENGVMLGTYIESSLQEGDWAIVVRPPSLHLGNTQPLRIRFWDKDCIGIHPETFSVFHGDFDGDEVQVYPVYNKESINECESWEVLSLEKFDKGREVFESLDDNLKSIDFTSSKSTNATIRNSGRADFLEYTTLSSKQLKNGGNTLYFGEYSRNKKQHIDGMYKRFNDSTTEDMFVSESIRGTEDVRRQQLSQGSLGDMTRVAKIAASCFFRKAGGNLYVASRTTTKLLLDDGLEDTGTPSVRAVAQICAVAQQAALDAHRAETHDSVSHDFVSDLILGCARKINVGPTSTYTFIQFNNTFDDVYGTNFGICAWKYITEDKINVLVKPGTVPFSVMKCVSAAYNPTILSGVQRSGGNITEVCTRGIKTVCNYYSIQISDIELTDIVQAFTYKPELHPDPITTRSGMMSRNLGWIETLLATDYTKLPSLDGDFEEANTSTAAMLMSNFGNLKLK